MAAEYEYGESAGPDTAAVPLLMEGWKTEQSKANKAVFGLSVI